MEQTEMTITVRKTLESLPVDAHSTIAAFLSYGDIVRMASVSGWTKGAYRPLLGKLRLKYARSKGENVNAYVVRAHDVDDDGEGDGVDEDEEGEGEEEVGGDGDEEVDGNGDGQEGQAQIDAQQQQQQHGHTDGAAAADDANSHSADGDEQSDADGGDDDAVETASEPVEAVRKGGIAAWSVRRAAMVSLLKSMRSGLKHVYMWDSRIIAPLYDGLHGGYGRSIQELEIVERHERELRLDMLACAMQGNCLSNLRSLSLTQMVHIPEFDDNDEDDDDFEEVAEGGPKRGLQALLEALGAGGSRRLSSLLLDGVLMTHHDARSFARALRERSRRHCTALKSLSILSDVVGIGKELVAILGTDVCRRLEKLEIQSELLPACVDAIAQYAQVTGADALHELTLSPTYPSREESVDAVGALLMAGAKNLRALRLHWATLSREGCASMARAVREKGALKQLQTLVMQDTISDKEGLEDLMASITHTHRCANLRVLDLSCGNIGAAAVPAVVRAIAAGAFPALEELSVTTCSIMLMGVDELKIIIEAIKKNQAMLSSLRSLNLQFIAGGPAGYVALKRALEDHAFKALKHVEVDGDTDQLLQEHVKGLLLAAKEAGVTVDVRRGFA